jgi:hypothetical protein
MWVIKNVYQAWLDGSRWYKKNQAHLYTSLWSATQYVMCRKNLLTHLLKGCFFNTIEYTGLHNFFEKGKDQRN